MDIFGVVVFIGWLISNMAAIPLMAAILTDGDACFFVPIEIWRRLRLKFSKTISGILLGLICCWFCLNIFINIILILALICLIIILGVCHLIKGKYK